MFFASTCQLVSDDGDENVTWPLRGPDSRRPCSAGLALVALGPRGAGVSCPEPTELFGRTNLVAGVGQGEWGPSTATGRAVTAMIVFSFVFTCASFSTGACLRA